MAGLFSRPALLAVVVAFQHLLADGFRYGYLNVINRLVWAVNRGVDERINNASLDPVAKLLHIGFGLCLIVLIGSLIHSVFLSSLINDFEFLTSYEHQGRVSGEVFAL